MVNERRGKRFSLGYNHGTIMITGVWVTRLLRIAMGGFLVLGASPVLHIWSMQTMHMESMRPAQVHAGDRLEVISSDRDQPPSMPCCDAASQFSGPCTFIASQNCSDVPLGGSHKVAESLLVILSISPKLTGPPPKT
jgi:hypothetical protein